MTDLTFEVVGTDVSDAMVRQITHFYNLHFPLSPHKEQAKARRYRAVGTSPINIVAVTRGRLIGLLESRTATLGGRQVRLLDTIVVEPGYRGRGVGRDLVECFLRKAESELEVVLHFRDQNRAQLEGFYGNRGFEGPRPAGNYRNGEPRWEMWIPPRPDGGAQEQAAVHGT